MKIYQDKKLTEEVHKLDLGIVQAGDNKEYEFFVYNDTIADLKELTFTIEHPEVSILSAPKSINAKVTASLKIKWSPSVTLKEKLQATLKIKGIELI